MTNEPYKGIRLMQIDKATLDNVLDVRATLESHAARRAIEKGHHKGAISRAWKRPSRN